jgi:hypothetical protein
MIRSAIFTVALLLVATMIGSARPAAHNHNRTVSLNPTALDYARKLITEGHFVNDKHGDWAAHKMSAEDENRFIRQHGTEDYARWHLGMDKSHQSDTKARYKFPFGDFKDVHRCALIAAQNRAHQYGYREIETAARELLTLVEARQSNPGL